MRRPVRSPIVSPAASSARVTHVEVLICLDILGPGSPYVDGNAPHATLSLPGGAIADFLTHLASLACFFVGPHRSARAIWSKRSGVESPLPSDEFRALVEAERGHGGAGFSSHTKPDAFWLPRLRRANASGGRPLRDSPDVPARAWRSQAAPAASRRPGGVAQPGSFVRQLALAQAGGPPRIVRGALGDASPGPTTPSAREGLHPSRPNS